jgi:hypothetical protein
VDDSLKPGDLLRWKHKGGIFLLLLEKRDKYWRAHLTFEEGDFVDKWIEAYVLEEFVRVQEE